MTSARIYDFTLHLNIIIRSSLKLRHHKDDLYPYVKVIFEEMLLQTAVTFQVIISSYFCLHLHGSILLCKANRQSLLTLQVSGYGINCSILMSILSVEVECDIC